MDFSQTYLMTAFKRKKTAERYMTSLERLELKPSNTHKPIYNANKEKRQLVVNTMGSESQN